MSGYTNEKINFYINTDLLEDGDDVAINKTAAIAKALKTAYVNKKDFISFVRSEMLRDLPITSDMYVRDIIINGRLRYNTCLQIGGCGIFLMRGTAVKYKSGYLRWDGRGSRWDFCFVIPEDTKVTFGHHENDFNSETLCALILL